MRDAVGLLELWAAGVVPNLAYLVLGRRPLPARPGRVWVLVRLAAAPGGPPASDRR